LRRLLAEDIELSLIMAKDLPRVLFDPGQLDQVIINLAANARDAMPKGGRLLIETSVVHLDEAYAAAHHEINPGKYVMLAFTDTGYGMDQETLSRVFEPFFTTKKKGEGTGLGLSTVYGIVKQSNGHIWVYSEPGNGTTFKVYLPPTEAKPKTQAEIVISPAPSGGEHILVVEDELSVRNLMKMLFSSLGYTVTIAANGDEALRLVEKMGVKPDLVITDVVMPKMSGKELIDRLRKTYPHLKALFMSGYTDNAIVHHGVLDPDTPFIQKPFNIQEIGKKVREVLGSNRS
ncbi:MAG TPA: ATP-binding protein, partial [bacterium]|nr:ATP-binding protein [bacterium]